jgi:hypothetical protein
VSRTSTSRKRPGSGKAGPSASSTGRTVACAVALLLCAELLVWEWIGGANDRVPVVAASLTLGVGAGVAAALLSLLLRRAVAVVVTLLPVIALVIASHLGPPNVSGTAALAIAFLLATVAASLVAVATTTRSGRLVLDAGAALVLLMLVGIEVGDRPPVKPIPGGDAGGDGPDIILLVMDTTRRDHLSVYGYPRETMPAVTRFARRAQIYDDAWSVAPWTTPSHASMLSGLLPGEHDADGEDAAPLPPGVVTLAAVLGDAGYRTAGFAANPNLHAPGWDRDYDV